MKNEKKQPTKHKTNSVEPLEIKDQKIFIECYCNSLVY